MPDLKSFRPAGVMVSTLGMHEMRNSLNSLKCNTRQKLELKCCFLHFVLVFVFDSAQRTPRLRSRPKFASDQTFQTAIISDQNFRTEIHPDQTFQTQVTSDQTFQTQKVSEQTFQTEGVLIRPYSDHGPDSISDHCADLNQTMIRLKCARSSYDQTQLRSKQL